MASLAKVSGLVVLVQLVFLTLLVWLGEVCVKFDVATLFHSSISTGWAILLTIVTGDISVVLAVVLKILVIVHAIHG